MQPTFIEIDEKPGGFDIKKFFFRLLRNYYWFLLSVAVFVTAAYFYLKTKVVMHQVSTSILLHPEQLQKGSNNNFSIVDDEIVMSNENMKDLVNNEVFILRSRSLISKVVDSLGLEMAINKNHKAISEEAIPFTVHVNRQKKEITTPVYALKLSAAGYSLADDNEVYKGAYGKPLLIKTDTFLLQLKEDAKVGGNQEYNLQLMSLNSTVGKYVSRVSVSPVPKAGVGMVQVSVKDEFYNRAKRFIEVLIFQFNYLNVAYKNYAEKKTFDFLNKRIQILEEQLKLQEEQVSDFKARNKIYDVSASATQLLSTMGSVDVQKSENDLKENLLLLIEKNVKGFNGVEEIVPNSSGLQDDVLIDQINQYNKLVLNKRLILDQGTANDPRLLSVNGQLEQLRINILKNVSNIRQEISTTKKSLSAQEKEYTSQFESLPQKEKQYIQLSRSLGIKESLYGYLLQKREESSLRLVSSDMAQSRIIDEGVYTGVVSPNKRQTYAVAGAAGLFLPFLILLATALFKRKIDDRDDIEANLTLPIAGEIGTAPKKKRIMIVSSGQRTPVAEQLRSLRSNLFYDSKVMSGKTILITSYMRGEGKSFISMNVADAIAAAGKKVILLDFDLRKGILSKKIQGRFIDNSTLPNEGIADFLKREVELETIVCRLNDRPESIYFAAAGSFVQNPAELILNDRMDELFSTLKKNYDYIIIDTPPVGFVADAITIGKWADTALFVIRHNYSLLSSVRLVKDLSTTNKLPNVSIVVNGIKKRGGYAYGGYGYGYHYDSYLKEIKAPAHN